MSEREDWIDLIRNEYDPKPDLSRGAYPAFDSEWDDGAGRIADAILADKVLLIRTFQQKHQDIDPSVEKIDELRRSGHDDMQIAMYTRGFREAKRDKPIGGEVIMDWIMNPESRPIP